MICIDDETDTNFLLDKSCKTRMLHGESRQSSSDQAEAYRWYRSASEEACHQGGPKRTARQILYHEIDEWVHVLPSLERQ